MNKHNWCTLREVGQIVPGPQLPVRPSPNCLITTFVNFSFLFDIRIVRFIFWTTVNLFLLVLVDFFLNILCISSVLLLKVLASYLFYLLFQHIILFMDWMKSLIDYCFFFIFFRIIYYLYSLIVKILIIFFNW